MAALDPNPVRRLVYGYVIPLQRPPREYNRLLPYYTDDGRAIVLENADQVREGLL